MKGKAGRVEVSIGRSPTAPLSAAGLLDQIGSGRYCRRLGGEGDRSFALRLALHLESIGLAVEDDIARVLDAERSS